MKSFIIKTICFFLIPIPIIITLGLVLPTTPRASKSLILGIIHKDYLLKCTKKPRLIFVGGSNLSFGLNSKMIKDSLHINPINTAIHACIGVKFMFENTLSYVKKGDVIIFVPEYMHFFKSLNSGSEELMRSIFDVSISKFKLLDVHQKYNILPFIPRYVLTKFDFSEYFNDEDFEFYSVNSFNKFGDTYTHWNLKDRQNEIHSEILAGKINNELFEFFKSINNRVLKKGATLYISFPAYQATSFEKSLKKISEIELKLKKTKLNIIGNSFRYKMPDSLFFNSVYHLNKKGVEKRTKLLIEDIRSNIHFNSKLNDVKQFH